MEEGDAKNRSKSAIDQKRVQAVREMWHLRHMLCIYAYKFISLGVLSDVKLDIGEMMIEDVERYLRSHHYLTSIHHRVKVQMLRYMRFLTILNAVHTVFNSEYGHHRRLRSAPWQSAHIIAIEPFLYVTEEIAWFTIGLFHEQILPVVQHRVLNNVAKMAGEAAPSVDTIDDPMQHDVIAKLGEKLEAAKRETDMEEVKLISDELRTMQERMGKLRFLTTASGERDFHYVEIGKSVKDAADEIANTMLDEAPSRTDIEQIIYKATTRSLQVPKRNRKTGKVVKGEFEKISAMKLCKTKEHGDARPVIFICIEYLRDMDSDIIENAIRSTFHPFTRRRDYRVLLGKKARVQIDGKQCVAHAIYQTIEVGPTVGAYKKRYNPYALNEASSIVGYKWIGATDFVNNPLSSTAVVEVASDYEEIIVADHLAEVGVNPEDKRVNLPPWTKIADFCSYTPALEACIANVREIYFKNEQVLYNYPEVNVSIMRRNIEDKRNLDNIPADRVAKVQPRYPAFAGKAWQDGINFRSTHYQVLRQMALRQKTLPKINRNPDSDRYRNQEEVESESSSSSSGIHRRPSSSSSSQLDAEDSIVF